ncbi:MAG: response regulator [Chthoniobacteraceae bacterium]|nr:response regulator [Chthoniobacteraceae bacterium]
MKKILIVDDEAGFTRLMKLTLQKSGDYEVIEENDGARAWEAARRERPDLILMDIVMPNVDGGDAAAQIRKDSDLAAIPIVFLTAIVSQKEAPPGGRIGGFPFLSKPVGLDALKACIEENLAHP